MDTSNQHASLTPANELIALYMGGEKQPPDERFPNNDNYNKPHWWGCTPNHPTTGTHYLNYGCSWDWLMPAVNKINREKNHLEIRLAQGVVSVFSRKLVGGRLLATYDTQRHNEIAAWHEAVVYCIAQINQKEKAA